MKNALKTAVIRGLDRINLRLPSNMFAGIDSARSARPGNVSRNTWITEAIEEKLAREATGVDRSTGDRLRHG